MSFSRRTFLGANLVSLLSGFRTFGQEQRYVVAPQVASSHRHLSSEDDNDAVEQALRRPAGTLKGFDPLGYVSSFDYGERRKLPDNRTLCEFQLVARDTVLEVAPGISFPAWTYNGSVPGPTLRCRVGDLVRVRFINESAAEHTIHFHGLHPANMDGVAEIIGPGSRYTYEFTAEPFGLHLYHCHTPPVALHLSRGLFGAFIVDPYPARQTAQELVMIAHAWDLDFDGKNEIYALNGPANYYRDNPVAIHAGELVRIYLISALEFEPVVSFHLHANFFQLFRTGSKLLPDEYTDVVTLSQAERCLLEFSYRYPGRFMFHSHQNIFAEKGLMGHFAVTA